MKLSARALQLFAGLFWVLTEVLGRPSQLIDLTYAYDKDTPTWPGVKKFEITERRTFKMSDTLSFKVNEFSSSEHSGTHMDAPYHIQDNKLSIDQLPLEHFEGPAVVINITEKAAKDSDAMLTLDDVEAWETQNGEILNGSIVLMNSGWGLLAKNQTAYFGGTDIKDLHYPGFSPDVCQWLTINRRVIAVGSDSTSADHGLSKDYGCHKHMAEANAIILENVANVHTLPPKGVIVRAYPLKITGGSGAPARVIAIIPSNPTNS